MKKDHWLYLAAALIGAAVWFAVTVISGRREAWDSVLYFSVGMPVVCIVSLALGYFEPVRWWRWGVLPLAGQFACLLITEGPGNLLPLGIVVFGVLSVPSIATAWIGAYVGARRADKQP